MFLYAPYQKPSEKTIISTNAGNRGNAHSEYLGPMAESGILGLLTLLVHHLSSRAECCCFLPPICLQFDIKDYCVSLF